MIFKNRYDAAMYIIPLLAKYKNENSVILAIPRGGVPIGFHIARQFNFPLEILLTKKIGHPLNQELAVGAVSLEGAIVESAYDISPSYIASATERIRESLKERYKKFMGNNAPIDIKDKTVLLVDDGIATGATVLAAIEMIRQKNPRKIIVVAPVSSVEAAARIRRSADEFICPVIVENLIGVSRFYEDFSEVSDEDVVEILNEL